MPRPAGLALLGTLGLAAGAAHGAYVGLAATSEAVTTSTGIDLTVYRVYATFDASTDQVSGVGGSPLFPQMLVSGGGGFFQQAVLGAHQDLPATDGAVAFIPDLRFDSYVTVGTPMGYAPPSNLATLSEHFNECTFNPPGGVTGFSTETVIHTDAGWFILPTQPETFATAFPPPSALPPMGDGLYDHVLGAPGPFGVLLGQYAVHAGNTFSGDLGLLSVREDGVAGIREGNTFSFVPPCLGDVDGSGDVGFGDILAVIGAWGPCATACAEDLDGSGDVGFSDVLAVISAWGACS